MPTFICQLPANAADIPWKKKIKDKGKVAWANVQSTEADTTKPFSRIKEPLNNKFEKKIKSYECTYYHRPGPRGTNAKMRQKSRKDHEPTFFERRGCAISLGAEIFLKEFG